jgi:pyridoxine 4-dehydrogenase
LGRLGRPEKVANVALFLASHDRSYVDRSRYRCRWRYEGVVIGGAEPLEGSIEEPLAVLAELKNQGLIRHLGVSNVTPNQLIEAQKITNVVCVQNFYNVANRNDDEFIDQLAKQGMPYVPFFPLGGFTPLQSSVLGAAAASLQATPMQIALAWLLQ